MSRRPPLLDETNNQKMNSNMSSNKRMNERMNSNKRERHEERGGNSSSFSNGKRSDETKMNSNSFHMNKRVRHEESSGNSSYFRTFTKRPEETKISNSKMNSNSNSNNTIMKKNRVVPNKERKEERNSYGKKNINSNDFMLLPGERETDSHRLEQRQKQLDYGKNTIGYDRYRELISKYV